MLILQRCAGNAPSRNLQRLISKTAQFQQPSLAPFCSRTASSSARANPVRPTANLTSIKLPPAQILPHEQQRAAQYAEKLYAAGKTALFRAPSHTAYLLGSWLLGLGCVAGTAHMIQLGHWKDDPKSELPWFVSVSYRISMMTLTAMGFWVVLRSTRLVTAIDLVQHAGKGKMRVSIRRIVPVPFVKPRHIVIAPYELHLPGKANAPAQVPDFATMPREDGSKPLRFGTWAARKISYSMYSVFAGTRKIFTHEGFLTVSIKGQGEFKIDLEGTFPNGVQSLIDVSTFAR